MKEKRDRDMAKFWDEILTQAENAKDIVRIEIVGDLHHKAYGAHAFTIPGLREWVKQNEKDNDRPGPWGGIDDVVYFTIKDQWEIESNKDEEVSIGFHMNVYSNDQEFKEFCYQEARLYLDKKLKLDCVSERDRRPVLTWKKQPDAEFVREVIKWVPKFVKNVLIKKTIDR